jgi:hypothetical protein
MNASADERGRSGKSVRRKTVGRDSEVIGQGRISLKVRALVLLASGREVPGARRER